MDLSRPHVAARAARDPEGTSGQLLRCPRLESTLYENWLIVGAAHGCKRILNPLIKRLVFDRSRGLAWIRHNIEEVGMLENILPSLYAAEHSRK